jgi:hypothetical protein
MEIKVILVVAMVLDQLVRYVIKLAIVLGDAGIALIEISNLKKNQPTMPQTHMATDHITFKLGKLST